MHISGVPPGGFTTAGTGGCRLRPSREGKGQLAVVPDHVITPTFEENDLFFRGPSPRNYDRPAENLTAAFAQVASLHKHGGNP